MARCRGCGAHIVFVRTKNGAKMPCDPGHVVIKRADPLFDGDRVVATVVTDDGQTVRGVAHQEDDDPDALVVGRPPHWASCPAAGRRWR